MEKFFIEKISNFLLQNWKKQCILVNAVTLIALKREVAAYIILYIAGFSVERMSC